MDIKVNSIIFMYHYLLFRNWMNEKYIFSLKTHNKQQINNNKQM